MQHRKGHARRTIRNNRVLVGALAAVAVLTLTACGGHSAADHEAAPVGAASVQSMPGPSMPGHTMPGMTMPMTDDGDGLSATKDGYTLAAVSGPSKAGRPGRLSFEIKGPGGAVHKEFTLAQTKLMHVYVVRKDLTGYQHVHPAMDPATGVWSVGLTLPQPGPYHVLTEFQALQPNHEDLDARKLGADFTVGGTYSPAPFTATPGPWSVDGYGLALGGEPKVGGGDLKLRITRAGSDVTYLQSYLESFAHVTGFREGDLKAVHVHPAEAPTAADPEGGPELTLSPMFAEPGTYRLFVEFQTAGSLHMVPMDVTVG